LFILINKAIIKEIQHIPEHQVLISRIH